MVTQLVSDKGKIRAWFLPSIDCGGQDWDMATLKLSSLSGD